MTRWLTATLSTVLFMSALASPAAASIFSFSVQFGADGSGAFVYDDDNGGPNSGLTGFDIDFSPALGASFASIGLSVAGQSVAGPGGGLGDALFKAFTDPSYDLAVLLQEPFLTPEINLAFAGSALPSTLDITYGTCVLPTLTAGKYAYCLTSTNGNITGSGSITTTVTEVPEPNSIALLGIGFLLLAGVRRARLALGATRCT